MSILIGHKIDWIDLFILTAKKSKILCSAIFYLRDRYENSNHHSVHFSLKKNAFEFARLFRTEQEIFFTILKTEKKVKLKGQLWSNEKESPLDFSWKQLFDLSSFIWEYFAQL